MAEDAVARDHAVASLIPDPPGGLTPYREACRLAIERQVTGWVPATWDDDVTAGADPADPLPSDPEWSGHTVYTDVREREGAAPPAAVWRGSEGSGGEDGWVDAAAGPAAPLPSDPEWSGPTVYTDVREREGAAPPAAVWRVIEGIGGKNGWYSAPLLWRIRGLLDQAAGGYGLARGRRRADTVEVGDHVDSWRVESVEPGRQLTLRSEMRAGGRAWLELSVDPLPGGGSRYRQRAIFFPRGVPGRLYWLAVLPFHVLIFPSMARNILTAAEAPRGDAG